MALGSPILFAPEIERGRLVRPFPIAIGQTAGFWLSYPKDRGRAAKVVAFRDWVLAAAAEAVAAI
jgi:LysR family glycine cleavage system transcriptional activator